MSLVETFQYTHFSSCHPFSVKKGFIKGETLRLLRTNSVETKFESLKRDFESRLLHRGYPRKLVKNIMAEIKFSSRKAALETKPKTSKTTHFAFCYNIQPGFTESQKDCHETLAPHRKQCEPHSDLS